MGFSREELERHVKAVEVVGAEGGLKNATNLVVVAGSLEFFTGAADGKVVDEDLALLEGALGDSTQLTQLKIAEALHADPDADSKHSENQSQRAAGRPQQEQAEEGEHSGNCIQHNHNLPMSKAVLEQFVMNVLTVGGENGTATDQAPENGERRFQNRQAEGNHGNRDRNDRRSFLGSGESEGAQQEADEETA